MELAMAFVNFVLAIAAIMTLMMFSVFMFSLTEFIIKEMIASSEKNKDNQ